MKRRACRERIERARELALPQVKDGEIEQQAHVIRRKDQRLAILGDGVVGVAAANQELRSGVVCGGDSFNRNCGTGARVGLELRDIGEVDDVVVNRAAGYFFITYDRLDLRRRNRRIDRWARPGRAGRIGEIVSLDAGHNRLRQRHLTRGRLVRDVLAIIDDVFGGNAAAVFQHDGVGLGARSYEDE